MGVYAKNLSDEWRKCFEQYEAISGFEPMYQEDIDSGDMDVAQAWRWNVAWLHDVYSDVASITTPFDIEGD